MKIEKVMSTDVHSCSERDSLEYAAKLMWEHDCGALPVTEEGLAIGVITDRDICMAAYIQGKALRDISVGGVMARNPITCSPSDDVAVAEAKMREHRVRRLPITENSKLVGVLSLNDLANALQFGKVGRNGVSTDEVAHTLAAVSAHRLPVWVTPSPRGAIVAQASSPQS